MLNEFDWGKLIKGDNLEVLKTFEDNSVDSIVTDPPSFIGFQGLEWDKKGDRTTAVKWLQDRLTEAFRVLKPGGFAVIWCLPRTSHYSMMATEEAGFTVVSVLSHFYGQGTPKGLNIEKSVAKINPERSTEFAGQNSSIKPACEFWVLAQKPISEKTIALNALKWGTGGLNIDKCRVSTSDNLNGGAYAKEGTERDDGWGFQRGGAGEYKQPEGRFPPNLLFTHHSDCKQVGTREVKSGTAIEPDAKDMNRTVYGKTKTLGRECGFGEKGKETIPEYECVEGCPVSALDEQTGELKSGSNCTRTKPGKFLNNVGVGKPGDLQKTFGDKGGASRFFPNFEWTEQDVQSLFLYCGKASPGERSAGLESKNPHLTIKPIKLMTWLVNLVTPKNGTVLDIFLGSGTTGIAAATNGYKFIGIEQNEEYFNVAKQRIEHYVKL